jgi:DNA-binding LacI/PurR family transcriptional regulator
MATIYDIARAAGVAKSTVANVLSGKGSVSEATRQRVLQYAQELGYRPNVIARSLYSHKTFTIALVLPSIANPFYPEIAEAVETTVRDHDYQTLICNTHGDFLVGRQQMEKMISRWVDGYIIMGTSLSSVDIKRYAKQGLPLVLCDWQENETLPDIPHVSVDFRKAGQLAAQHLLELGHRSMAVIGDVLQQRLRLEGFQSVLQAANIALPADMVMSGDSSFESGYQAMKRLLERAEPPTAVFTTNDWMAHGAIEAAVDSGLSVPHDLSVIGLDDIFVSAHLRPALTTIAIPKAALVDMTTDLLLHEIAGDRAESIVRFVEPYLVLRQTTAAVSHV